MLAISALILVVLAAGGTYAFLALRRAALARPVRARCFLRVLVPKKEQRDDRELREEEFRDVIAAMEPLFAGLHGIQEERFWEKQARAYNFGLEYVVTDGEILFLVSMPRKYKSLFEKQISAQEPDAFIEEVAPPRIFLPNAKQAGAALRLKKPGMEPIRTYKRLETDPLNALTNVLSKLRSEDTALVQFLFRPAGEEASKAAQKAAKELYEGKEKKSGLLGMIMRGAGDDKKEPKRLTPAEEEHVKAIEQKGGKVAFETVIRVVTSSPEEVVAKQNLLEIVSAFSQYSDPMMNAFRKDAVKTEKLLPAAIYRTFAGAGTPSLLSTEEIASLYHWPHARFNKAPTIKWQNYKIAPAPVNLPKEGVLLGRNTYRGETKEVRMTLTDRFRHMYIIGQTGTGKSTMLLNMALQDIEAGRGVTILDPHGELARDALKYIPKHRIDDVVFFNPADTARPMGLNILEAKTQDEKDFVVNEAMSIMIKLFGNEIFGPRLQDYFRNGCLTLLDDEEEGGTLVDLVRLFTDEDWQRYKVRKLKNPVVRQFWEKQMAATGKREKEEMIPFWAAKFGQFITNSTMRNIIGQTKSAFDFSDVMNNGKILLINASKGELGEFNSNLLGMIIVTKLTQAAFRRAGMAPEERRDFFLYIDEFQNFVTDSIEAILSEARKYRMSLNIAHQYIGQLTTDKNDKIKNAVFGNVGSMMCYKIGAQDAEYMAKEFGPVFTEQDLINIDRFKSVAKISVDGQPSRPFTLIAEDPFKRPANPRMAEALVQLSRLTYGREKRFVDWEILARIGTETLSTTSSLRAGAFAPSPMAPR